MKPDEITHETMFTTTFFQKKALKHEVFGAPKNSLNFLSGLIKKSSLPKIKDFWAFKTFGFERFAAEGMVINIYNVRQ